MKTIPGRAGFRRETCLLYRFVARLLSHSSFKTYAILYLKRCMKDTRYALNNAYKGSDLKQACINSQSAGILLPH